MQRKKSTRRSLAETFRTTKVGNKYVKILIKYGACFLIMALITVIILVSVGFSTDQGLTVVYLNLADAFCIPAMVMIALGALVWVSTTGFFDSLGYIVKIGVRALIPMARKGQYEKYYDYKVRKDGKRITGYGFILISGCIYLLIGVIFTLLFFTVYQK